MTEDGIVLAISAKQDRICIGTHSAKLALHPRGFLLGLVAVVDSGHLDPTILATRAPWRGTICLAPPLSRHQGRAD
jgi:hypothetical protein